MLHSHNQLYIHICMQKYSQQNKDERTQFFRKISLSLYPKGLWKGYCVRGELETGQKLQHIDPQALPAIATLLSRSPGLLNRGSGSLSSDCNKWLQTLSPNWVTSCRTRVISLFDSQLLPVASQFALNSTGGQSRLSPDIFDRMHLLFTQVHFLFDSSAGSEVTMLQEGLGICLSFHFLLFLLYGL